MLVLPELSICVFACVCVTDDWRRCYFISAGLLVAMAIPNAVVYFGCCVVLGTTVLLPFGFLRSQFSKAAPPESQGVVLSGMAALEILATIAASFLQIAAFGCVCGHQCGLTIASLLAACDVTHRCAIAGILPSWRAEA